tara:strand:- start:563 stop:1750 length:1188 start_codon:yes stop_codon:yes gene_type:complete
VKIRLKPAAERAVRGGHPWVFGDSVKSESRQGQLGDLATIYDRNDKFLAIGIYEPESPIRIRILHKGKPVQIDAAFRRQRFLKSINRRNHLFGSDTNGYRLINGESDGWPALVLDRYDDTLVLKIYSTYWLTLLDELSATIVDLLKPDHLVLRMSRNIQALAAEQSNHSDGQMLIGDVSDPVLFSENGICFESHVRAGQKTGFFLDQRENRQRVEQLAEGRTVLNCFSFSGGFSLYAARGDATSVADLDISQHALESASRNFSLNEDDTRASSCPREQIKANAFDWLKDNPDRRFDMIIMDPPSLAKKKSERKGAICAYQQLTRVAIGILASDGILVSASCSAHVRADEFFSAIPSTAQASGRAFKELDRTLHAPDHPASFPEAEYLKCIYLHFD